MNGKLCLAPLLLVSLMLSAHRRDRYVERYSVEPEIAAILDRHSDQVFKCIKSIHKTRLQKHGVWQFDWLPGYYVKYGLARIDGMERMNKCIERNDLDLLWVPEKKIYHIKGRPRNLSSLNYAVIIEAVPTDPKPAPLSLEHVNQLCSIIHNTDYISMTPTNFIPTIDDRIALIDTEATFNRSLLLKGFTRMLGDGDNLRKRYTQKGLDHIMGEIKKQLRKHPQLEDVLKRQLKPYYRLIG